MNIRSIGPRVHLPQEKEKKEALNEVTKDVSVETSYEEYEGRGRNSQDQQDERNNRKLPLSDEEIEKTLSQLKSLPGIKDHRLIVKMEIQNNQRIIFIEDSLGHVIRRIPESDFWSILESKDKIKGQIFDKAM